MTDDPYDMRANSVYKLREELAFALKERDEARSDNARLMQLLKEALEGYEDCISYKSEYLVDKHGDKEEVARIRAAVGESDETA